MSNKKRKIIEGVIAILGVLLILCGCSKKESKMQTQAKDSKNITSNENKAENSYMKEANKAFSRAKVAPASDFSYGLTDSGDGVVIKKYIKKKSDEDVEIIIPSEIQGIAGLVGGVKEAVTDKIH